MILAEDEAGLYEQATTESVWARRGQTPVVRVSSSRGKAKFYGTLNLRTGRVHTKRCEVFNSQQTAQHLEALLDLYPERRLLVLWDRASWHGGEAVKAVLAAHPRLDVVRFPPGSPELNPQEQVWKRTRQAISHNNARLRFAEMADAFEDHLQRTTFRTTLLDKYGFNQICPMFTS